MRDQSVELLNMLVDSAEHDRWIVFGVFER
jgi:hypothetical protein